MNKKFKLVREEIARLSEITERRISATNDNARWYTTFGVAELAVVVTGTLGIQMSSWRGGALLIGTVLLVLAVLCFVLSVYRSTRIRRGLTERYATYESVLAELSGMKPDEFREEIDEKTSKFHEEIRKEYFQTYPWDGEILNTIGLFTLLAGTVAAGVGLLFAPG